MLTGELKLQFTADCMLLLATQVNVHTGQHGACKDMLCAIASQSCHSLQVYVNKCQHIAAVLHTLCVSSKQCSLGMLQLASDWRDATARLQYKEHTGRDMEGNWCLTRSHYSPAVLLHNEGDAHLASLGKGGFASVT